MHDAWIIWDVKYSGAVVGVVLPVSDDSADKGAGENKLVECGGMRRRNEAATAAAAAGEVRSGSCASAGGSGRMQGVYGDVVVL